jgi:aminoglycoside phosphotransferase (APT) family kinase protein
MSPVTLGRQLGRGKQAQIFEYGSKVAKLYGAGGRKEAAFREAAILAGLEDTAVPAPSVWSVQMTDQRWGLVMDRVTGATLAERMRQDHSAIPSYLDHMAQLHLRIHAHRAARLGRGASELTAELKTALENRLRRMRRGDRLCHGDFHPENILGEPADAVVVDWLDASRGDPAADVCRSYLLLHLHASDIAMPYVDAYCRAARIAQRSVLRWLPIVAAARLAEGVPDEVPRLLELCQTSLSEQQGP